MYTAPRTVVPELLDTMSPDDPLAQRSRRDLRRIHFVMGTLGTIRRALLHPGLSHPPRRILELGAGDGTLLLRLARSLATRWPDVELTLLDRQNLITRETREAYARLGWRVSVSTTDIQRWAAASAAQRYDWCVTTLFLHHFSGQELLEILAAVAARSKAFLAVEPRRDAWTRLGGRLVGVVGGNRVTRSDAIASVNAGFAGDELTRLWPGARDRWSLEEAPAFPFSHRFCARARDSVTAGLHS